MRNSLNAWACFQEAVFPEVGITADQLADKEASHQAATDPTYRLTAPVSFPSEACKQFH